MYFQIQLWLFLQFISYLTNVSSFYIPGMQPIGVNEGNKLIVQAVKLTSSYTQLPYEYYSLPFCRPDELIYTALNLGEVLRGDRIVNTPYDIRMKNNAKCNILCNITLTKNMASTFSERILEKYMIHLLIDDLPSVMKVKSQKSSKTNYILGFLLGEMIKKTAYINNHLIFNLKYNKKNGHYHVVGFEVEAESVDRKDLQILSDLKCSIRANKLDAPQDSSSQIISAGENVYFTYSVNWEESDIPWSSRWDRYLELKDWHVHWFSILNSIVIILFLAGILTMIIMRTLKKDIAYYNREEENDESLEESGWKLVHGDVFRPPRFVHILSALVGSGVQLLLMSVLTIALAMLGMLSPASRGALVTTGLFFYVFMGVFAGFFSSRLYKTSRGQRWKLTALWTALFVPGIFSVVGFVLNFFVWGESSSKAVPLSTMLALLAMWLLISMPLVFLGSYFGYRKQPYQHPVRTNQIPRCVPPQKWHHNALVGSLISGILPFGAVFIELFFIFSAIWERQIYYMFGFLFIVFIIMVISVSQIAIVMVYFRLCSENYHWWWRSFVDSGGIAVYVMAYSVFYFVSKLEIVEAIPALLYFCYSFLISFLFWIMNGTIGFYAAYFFIRKIYAAIKIE